ncbi:hypothetical protein GCM10010245_88840 [Streptomyces spectabilis]|uniref:Uncharacterized protein n=1 Tax=Streptomyces spectabilis TaxID=68270 RepID=A0A7W8B411_STRST|nr:hypothetical protein [Streptomyces spectabilis]MBB5109923.1 hypothetical protein [Streptomyces spectabilis]GGV55999.1 hypothetical protein GCM10010245_88840 [Streptomyces spectabilis]
MVSLLGKLERREAVIRERVAELRLQVAELSEQLEGFEEVLSQVEVARRVVREILDDATADEPVPSPDAGRQEEAVSPIGVVTVPQWEPGMGISVLSPGYQDVVEVLRPAGRPLRSKAVSVAIGWGEGGGEGGVDAGEAEAADAQGLAHRGQPGPVRAGRTGRRSRAVPSGIWRVRTLLDTKILRWQTSTGGQEVPVGCRLTW